MLRLGQHAAHPVGEIGRERKLAAVVGRHLRVFGVGARDIDLVLDQRLVFQDFAGEHESVAGHQRLDEILLDLAEHAAAARDRPGVTGAAGARAHQAHLEHVGLDDGADIHPVALRHHRIGDAPAAVLGLPDLGEALVGLERIAAGRDEIDDGIEVGAAQSRVRRRGLHLAIELVGDERLAAGAPEHMLRQHIERAGAERRRVLRMVGDRADARRCTPAPRSGWPE